MSLRYHVCKALTFLRMHPLDCAHCHDYWSCAGDHMRARLQDLRQVESEDFLAASPGTGDARNEAATQDWLKGAGGGSRVGPKPVDRFELLIRARNAQKKDIA